MRDLGEKKQINHPNQRRNSFFFAQKQALFKKKFGVTKIALFGSFARDEQRKKSDIDILIDMKIHNFRKRLGLRDFLEEKFQRKVDVLYFDAVRKFIMRNIQEDIVYA